MMQRCRANFVVLASSPVSPQAFPEPQKANDEPDIETANHWFDRHDHGVVGVHVSRARCESSGDPVATRRS